TALPELWRDRRARQSRDQQGLVGCLRLEARRAVLRARRRRWTTAGAARRLHHPDHGQSRVCPRRKPALPQPRPAPPPRLSSVAGIRLRKQRRPSDHYHSGSSWPTRRWAAQERARAHKRAYRSLVRRSARPVQLLLPAEDEIERPRRGLKHVEIELDILKKALSIFSRRA